MIEKHIQVLKKAVLSKELNSDGANTVLEMLNDYNQE